MNINRTNYELFFLDHHEGNLDDVLKNELFLFLENNPDLKEEFESFEEIPVSAPVKKFSDKDRLKKNTITQYNYKTWFVAYVENDLNAAEKREAELFIEQNPVLKPELEILRQIKINPEHTIVFENKKQLKHSAKVIQFTPQFYRVGIAAAIALLVLAYFFFRNNKDQFLVDHEKQQPEMKQQVYSPQEKVTATAPKEKRDEKTERKSIGTNHDRKQVPPLKSTVPAVHKQPNEPLFVQHMDLPDQNPIKENQVMNKDTVSQFFAEKKDTSHKQVKFTALHLSEIFSEDELAELGAPSSNQQKKNKTLLELAGNKASELSKDAGIRFSKQKNEGTEATTYALLIGGFSVTHTFGK